MKLKILSIGLACLLFLLTIILGSTVESAPKIGASCDDGNKCTVNDVFRPNGTCTGAQKPPPASKPKPCKEFVCRTATGKFSEVNKINGTTCDDKNPYTSNDKCSKGICQGTNDICDPDGDGKITDKFKDANLLAAIKNALGKEPTDDITLQDSFKATSLKLYNKGLKDISGIECFTKLTKLDLSLNKISDITPLAGLVNLIQLTLSNNKISNNLAPLAGLTNLMHIDLWSNQISDVTPLKGLINLDDLGIGTNKIIDITPLAGLANLNRLDIRWNEISDLTPLANLTNLTELTLTHNNIPKFGLAPLADLINLKWFYADENQISDVTPLSGLINLVDLSLKSNLIQDITAIINNPGIGFGDYVCLLGNTQIPQSQWKALGDKGVDVTCMKGW